MKRLYWIFAFSITFCLVAPTITYSAVDMFLKIDGIDGEAQDPGHVDWIEIHSFNHEIKVPSERRSGQASGRRQHSPFSVTKTLDKASPKLYQAICQGNVFLKIELNVYRADAAGQRQKYFTIVMEDVLITSFQSGGSDQTGAHMESISFNYRKIKWTYVPDGIEYEDNWEAVR